MFEAKPQKSFRKAPNFKLLQLVPPRLPRVRRVPQIARIAASQPPAAASPQAYGSLADTNGAFGISLGRIVSADP